MLFFFKPHRGIAYIKGGNDYPEISGFVKFLGTKDDVLVKVYLEGLPEFKPATPSHPQIGPHGFHLHEKGQCENSQTAPFVSAGPHYNPNRQLHGNHAGDFPVLFSNNGRASMSFFTNKFHVADIIGRSVIIHEGPDDYRTQPSGNSGKRIACGTVIAY
jgi:Cu-Zn family superoxide dismutase